jgi:2-dehydropantoate 2-reductase
LGFFTAGASAAKNPLFLSGNFYFELNSYVTMAGFVAKLIELMSQLFLEEISMQEIRKVAVLGAGAMGAYFATCFYNTPGFSTCLIADGPRWERLSRDGITVNGKAYFIPTVRPGEAASPVDLLIVALKHHQLRNAIQNLGKLVGDETVIMSVMNGLESEEIIGSIYGMDRLLYTISIGIDAVRENNQVTYTQPGTHIFGEARNESITPKVWRVQEAFDRAGVRYEIPQDMMRMLWWKFMINVGVNQASAVLRAPYGVFQTNAQSLMEGLMQEVVSLAKVHNVNLTQEDINNWYPVMGKLSPQGKTSMLQDIEAGRKTEVEVFAGKVIEMGQAQGIPTPVNRTVFQIIRVLEQNTAVE